MHRTTFDPAWLALREAADAAARADALVAPITRALPAGGWRGVDLASGTGANVRHLAPQMPSPQEWLLADADKALLAATPTAMARWAPAHACHTVAHDEWLDVTGATLSARLTCRQIDFAAPDALDAIVDGRHLVTASALLDLVSQDWLDALVTSCRRAGAAVLFALSYDGRAACDPPDADDARVCSLVNQHQRGNKGFGPALGPDAPATAERLLGERGYAVKRASSDWRLGTGQTGLQRELIEGWAAAAGDMPESDRTAIDAWRARRLAHLEAGLSTIEVGHQDIAAWLP